MVVTIVVASAPREDSVSRLKSPTRVINFFCSDSRCRQNVSNFISRYVGSAQYGRYYPSTLIEKLTSCLFVIKVEGSRHSFDCTELQLPFLEVRGYMVAVS